MDQKSERRPVNANDCAVKNHMYYVAVCLGLNSQKSESRQQAKLAAQALNSQSGDGGSPTLTPATSIMTLQVPDNPVQLKDLPPNFHPTAHKNLDACFGEAMQVLQDDQIIDPIPKGLEELDRVAHLSRIIMRWVLQIFII
jgi:hypothetical protein